MEPFSSAAHTGMELTEIDLDDLLFFQPTGEGAWLEPMVMNVLQEAQRTSCAWLEPMVMNVLQEVRCAAGGGIPWNSGPA